MDGEGSAYRLAVTRGVWGEVVLSLVAMAFAAVALVMGRGSAAWWIGLYGKGFGSVAPSILFSRCSGVSRPAAWPSGLGQATGGYEGAQRNREMASGGVQASQTLMACNRAMTVRFAAWKAYSIAWRALPTSRRSTPRQTTSLADEDARNGRKYRVMRKCV